MRTFSIGPACESTKKTSLLKTCKDCQESPFLTQELHCCKSNTYSKLSRLFWVKHFSLHIAMKNNNSKSGSYGHSISHMTLLLHKSLHYCVTSPAHRCSDLTLSRNDNERWAPPPRAPTPLPVPSGLQSPNFNTFWNRYYFIIIISANNSFRFLIT